MIRLPRFRPAALALWLCLTCAFTTARAQVFISEFMALNQFTQTADEDGERSDWIELHNAGTEAVSLNGWYLTDNAADLRKWQFPVAEPAVILRPNERLLVYASHKNRKLLATRLHTNFRLEHDGEYLALVRPDGLTVEHAYGPQFPQQVQDVSYGLPNVPWQPIVAQGAAGRAKVPASPEEMPPGWNSSVDFDDSAWQPGQSGFGYDTTGSYGTLIGEGGDLQAAMHQVNATALVRIVFDVADPNAITALRLQMKYDDGFICHLNGVLIAQSNAPTTPAFDSSAAADRSGGLTPNFEIFNTPGAHQALVAGANVLAIQLLNHGNGSIPDTDAEGTPNGSRALALPVLEAMLLPAPAYLSTATPRTANSGARSNIGPLISETTDAPPRPLGSTASPPIVVTTKVLPSLRPVNTVVLRYRIMFSGESTLPMRDDGTGGDAVAGDNIFTAQIPTANVQPGQMLRWRVIATDSGGIFSTSPRYLNPADNDQYFGTVALESQTANSRVPVLHWFVQDTSSSRTEGGTRCALFFLGSFYDNVFVQLHGQSSSGFPVDKKSHDFNFSKDNRFLWKEGEDRQRAINLITTWADKSRVRDTLAWESWAEAGHRASHWAQLVRVQQNGAFWGVYDMVENGGEDFLERTGLDPFGALYKAYNSLQDAGGVEKKSREWENTADLQALITNMDTGRGLTARRQYAYDHIDVPTLVNYLANNIVIQNNDFGHKNYYIYRDTNGTGEWILLPWDQDLSLGHTWTSSQNYFNDDIDSQKAVVMGAGGNNRVMNLILSGTASNVAPEMAQMLLRRVRTLMDTRLMPPGSADGPLETRIYELLDSIDPPGAAFQTDADADLQKWGYWLDGSGSPISQNNNFDAATHDHGARRQAMRIINSNPSPPYPAAQNNAEGLGDTTRPFLQGRRHRLYNTNPTLIGLSIPPAQTALPQGLSIEQVDFNPASGKADEEFFVIKNSGPSAIDISSWTITGAVNHTFLGGTVVPAGGGATENIGLLHVARNPRAFRERTSGPRGGQFRLVVGPYNGRLSARGGALELRNAAGALVASHAYTGAPTPAQEALRISEIHFAPKPPTPEESSALPGVQAGDFEFLELINTGSVALQLGGSQFDRGISFTFPADFTLEPGARALVVSSLIAFAQRYGGGFHIAGQFEGNLDNSGEQLRLLDPVGEEVVRFSYSPWYPQTAGGGYSLVAGSAPPAFDGSTAEDWRQGVAMGGTPCTQEPPILATPASGSITGSPIEVAFAVIDAPLSGSLKLLFDDGTNVRELTLAPQYEAPGIHTFSFDPANPAASEAIVAGPPLPDGVYSVRLSSRDSENNPEVASEAALNVTLDRVPPEITPPANQIAEATSAEGATVFFPEASATDPAGVASITYSHAPGSMFPLGVTTVTVTAADRANNTSAATFTVTVQDTTPPMISARPADRLLNAGTNGMVVLPDFTGEIVAADNVGVVQITQSPAPGALLPLGVHEVSFILSDAAGNTSSTSAAITVGFAKPAQAEASAIAATGAPAPGSGAPGGPPAGARLTKFGAPAISDFRHLAARATLQHGRKKLGAIYFTDGAGAARILAFKGSPAPGISGAVFQSFMDPLLSPSGLVAFAAKVSGGGATKKSDEGVWTDAFTGELALALREGGAVPGAPGIVLRKIVSFSLRDAELLALVTLQGSRRGGSDTALLRLTAEGGAVLLRKGQPLTVNGASSTVAVITTLTPARAASGHGRWHGDTAAIAKVTLADKRQALVSFRPDNAAEALLVSGDPAAGLHSGAVWESFSLPAIAARSGNMAVQGGIAAAAGAKRKSSPALAASIDAGAFTAFAEAGAIAPESGGATFAAFSDPLVNSEGRVAFLAALQRTRKVDRTGLWWGMLDAPSLLARLGQRALDRNGQVQPGRIWSAFLSHALPDGSTGGPILLARVKGAGITQRNNTGIWAATESDVLRELLRTGDSMLVGGQPRIVAKMTLLNASRGVFGATRSFNSTGSIALHVVFTDKSEALVRLEIP